jgi:hypothetical protein
VTAPALDPLSSPCPHCGVVLNCHITPDGKDSNPLPGDVTFCSECDSILMFAADLSLRLPNEGEKRIIFRSFHEEIPH